MSASREKKSRQDLPATGWADPKTAQEAKQRKETRRSNIMYASIAVVFVIVALTAIVWKSNIFQKRAVAANINGETYTAAEVSYYFQNTYQNFVNQNYYYLSYFGLDPQTSLRDQAYGSDGQTWFDYFSEQTLEQMKAIQALNDAAQADGFTWTDELQAEMDASMESLSSYAATSGYTAEQYLRAIYGGTMTQKIYQEQLQRSMLGQAYAQAYEDSLTYSSTDLAAAYDAARNTYDVADYESILVSGTVTPEKDADGNEIEVTEEQKAAALAEAKKTADKLYASFQSGESLSKLAEGDDTLKYTDGEAAGYYDTALLNWVFDSARTAGDSTVLADESNSNYYVVVFHDRYRQEYNTVNVRHILIQPAAGELAEGDEGYADEQAKLKADAKAKAEEILAQFKAGEATEDAFAQLAVENSADSNAAQGGLYTQVAQGTMVETFNDWIFDAARKPGDTGIVETTYGYHVMYFSGTDLPYWELQVTNALKSEDFDAWYAEKTADYTAEADSGMQYVG